MKISYLEMFGKSLKLKWIKANSNSKRAIQSFTFLLFTFYFSLFTFSFLLFTFAFAKAHRYHTSLTRIDYNEKEKTGEITIRLFTHDLEIFVDKKTGKKLDLEKSADVDKLIFEYLNSNFVIKDKNGKPLKLEWVGQERDTDTTWVYVQVPLADGLENLNMKNTVFFDIFEDQTNLVIFKTPSKKADLLFKSGDDFKEIRFKDSA